MTKWYEHENVTPEWIEAMKTSNRIANDYEPWEWEAMEGAARDDVVLSVAAFIQTDPITKWGNKDPETPLYSSSPYRIDKAFNLTKREVVKFYKLYKLAAEYAHCYDDEGQRFQIKTDGTDDQLLGYCHDGDLGRITKMRDGFRSTGGERNALQPTVLVECIESGEYTTSWATHVAIREEVEE